MAFRCFNVQDWLFHETTRSKALSSKVSFQITFLLPFYYMSLWKDWKTFDVIQMLYEQTAQQPERWPDTKPASACARLREDWPSQITHVYTHYYRKEVTKTFHFFPRLWLTDHTAIIFVCVCVCLILVHGRFLLLHRYCSRTKEKKQKKNEWHIKRLNLVGNTEVEHARYRLHIRSYVKYTNNSFSKADDYRTNWTARCRAR